MNLSIKGTFSADGQRQVVRRITITAIALTLLAPSPASGASRKQCGSIPALGGVHIVWATKGMSCAKAKSIARDITLRGAPLRTSSYSCRIQAGRLPNDVPGSCRINETSRRFGWKPSFTDT